MNRSRAFHTLIFVMIALVVSVGLFTGSVAGGHENPNKSVEYTITHNIVSNQTTVTVAFTVTDTEKYDIWNGQWNVPEDATIVNASSAHSDSVEVERDGATVRLKERDGGARKYETFYLTYETSSQFTVRDYGGITQFQASLAAYRNYSSTVSVEFVGGEVANSIRYSNHSVVTGNNTVQLDGTGPIGFVANVKSEPSRVSTDDFVVYGGDLSTDVLNSSYALSTSGTGVIPQYKQVPVLIIEENEYDVQFGNASAGRYHRGVVFVSEDEVAKQGDALVLLTHEYTHAVTARVQGERGTPRWFTEGASQYTESIAREKVGQSQVMIDEEKFEEYESENKSWVVTSWESRVDSSNINFAYSYAELLFKTVERDDSGAVRELYANMLTGEVKVPSDTTPRVLFKSSWNGTACGASVECAEKNLKFVPNSSQPESYMLAIDGHRTNRSVEDSNEVTPTPTPTPEESENTTTEENKTTTSGTETPSSTQTETEDDEIVVGSEPSSTDGSFSWLEDIIEAVLSFLSQYL